MSVLLALASSLCYGIADFLGGLLSRRAPSRSIAFAGQAPLSAVGGLALPVLIGVLLLGDRRVGDLAGRGRTPGRGDHHCAGGVAGRRCAVDRADVAQGIRCRRPGRVGVGLLSGARDSAVAS
jgi:hypothetical protein